MKKIYNRIFLSLFTSLLIVGSAFGQINLAPSATCTCNTTSGGTTSGGGWNWNQINDGVNSSCNTQEAFIWTQSPPASTDEMVWTWTSAKSINKIVFHNANPSSRNLTGCDVLYWNGSTYAFWKTITISQGCLDSASFPTVTTTSLKLNNIKMTGTGQTSNPNFRDILIISGPSVNNDVGVSALGTLDFCNNTQSLSARVFNYGKFKLDSFRLYWSLDGVLQTPRYITSSLGSAKDTSIVLNPTIGFTNNTTYTFKFWTSKPNGTVDSVAANDTLKYSLKFFGNPPAPTTTNYTQCGVGFPTLKGTTGISSDTIMWFRNASGGASIGMGQSLKGPYITNTTTFYAQAFRFAARKKLTNGFNGTTIITGSSTYYNGNFFDVSTTSPLNIDSILFRLYLNNPTTNYLLYYKTGSYNGFESNSAPWNLINSGTGRYYVSGGQYLLKVSAKDLLLTPGTYGFYFTTDPTTGGGNDIFMKGSSAPVSDGDMSIVGGKYGYGTGLFSTSGFGGTWSIDCEFSYSKACINGTRTPLKVTVNPRPIGSEITKGTPFDGQYRVGDITTPDISEVGKTIVYELKPPTGYNNSNHNSAWVVNNVEARTRYGVLVPNTEYQYNPPSGSSGNGTITFTPKAAYLDSFITFSFKFIDLGPYYCDSTVKRTVVVAPTPKPNFKFPVSICLGDVILFDNVTTIHSGNASYIWYFGDGDSSDNQSPVHEYKAAGVYQVTLKAKSFPWNTLKDTTITLEVGELPDAKFRANNKCEGIAVSFQNQSSIGNGTLTYDWDFGDNSAHSTLTNPSHLYTNPGGYKVTLKASANGCVATLIKNAYTFARPVPNFAAPLAPVCAKSEVLLPNTSTIAQGSQGAYWTYGDGGSSTQFEGNHTYTNPGTYAVKLLAVSEFDCRDSITKNVTIKPTPNPQFAGNQFCGKIPTVFTNNTVEDLPNPVYTWTFSDGFTSTQKNLTRSWPYEGPFNVNLKAAYSNGCSASMSQNVNVLIQPKAKFSVQDICSGENANFVNQSSGDRGNIQYYWDFGNGTFSNIAAPVRIYQPTTTTTYTVSLVASYAGGCSDTTRKNINVSESPICDFNYTDNGLFRASFAPTNTSYTSYEWFFGEGGTSNSTSPQYQYLYGGSFNVTMKATNAAGCDCEITKRISASTGVNDVTAKLGINIYPNPNNGTFTVNNASNAAMKVEVFNVLGEKILTKTSSDGNLTINMDSASKGIYLVKVTINGVTSTTKITVTN